MQARYMVGMAVDATGAGMYLPLSLLYFHHVTGLPVGQVGALISSAALIGLIGNPVSGVLVDRFGARTIVVGGYLVRAVGFTAYAFVHSPAPMFLAVLLVSFGDVSFSPSIQSFIAEIVQGQARDRMLAAQRSLRNAGLGLGGLIAAGVLALDADAAYLAVVLTAAVTYLLTALIMRSIPVPPGRHAPAGAKRGYRLVARNRPFLTLTLLNIPIAFGYMVLSVSLPVYVTQHLSTPASLIGVLYAINTFGIAVLQIPVTRALARYRRTRATALGAAVFCVSFVGFALLGLLPARSAVLAGVFLATALFTLGELLHGAAASALVASAAPAETRGRHLAVYQLSWAVPTALAPAVLTALLTFSPAGMWLVLALGVTASAVTLLGVEPRLPHDAVRPAPQAVTVG
ncbi:MFS transporter [Mangrovihabitans endophyticus]|uniref:MFS transporter n=1 Tax=Mangrovihabitans endophyticus TaxID=1751298 RepID=A0A8J3FLQ2_9ACTN|nr:MFS transporter [Mangrovihabitans endophyticus]